MAGSRCRGRVASLNVSVATGIVLFEAIRQRAGGQVASARRVVLMIPAVSVGDRDGVHLPVLAREVLLFAFVWLA